MSILKQFTDLFVGNSSDGLASQRPRKRYSERQLLRKESKIGRELFGPLPAGSEREFFCLDERTWIWYEKWTDPTTRKPVERTTRYEVHTNGIIKIQEGNEYVVIEGQELYNLEAAVRMYRERVAREVYQLDPASLRPLDSSIAA